MKDGVGIVRYKLDKVGREQVSGRIPYPFIPVGLGTVTTGTVLSSRCRAQPGDPDTGHLERLSQAARVQNSTANEGRGNKGKTRADKEDFKDSQARKGSDVRRKGKRGSAQGERVCSFFHGSQETRERAHGRGEERRGVEWSGSR